MSASASSAVNTARSRKRSVTLRRSADSALSHGMLIIVAALFVVPFLWLIITSLKDKPQVFTDPPTWIPSPIRWENYATVLTSPAFPFLRLLGNTVFYSAASVIATVVSSTFVAYGFARLEFRGKNLLFGITLATLLLPGIVTLIPSYVLFRTLGWVGTYAPLILPLCFGSAFNIFLLRQFMLTIPHDLTDAARVDGASDYTILWRIMVPLIKPAILVVAIFQFLASWNDFQGPLIYLSDVSQFPLVLGLNSFRTRFGVEWHLMMAATMLTTLPIIVLFFVAQRYFIEGVTLTGMKG
jgi:ABC-type glycerol-3-phosphate transport system permease component